MPVIYKKGKRPVLDKYKVTSVAWLLCFPNLGLREGGSCHFSPGDKVAASRYNIGDFLDCGLCSRSAAKPALLGQLEG